jgi:TPR repeat protein
VRHIGLVFAAARCTASNSEQDYDRAIFWFTKAAEQNVATAQSRLGLLYVTAQGVAVDYIEVHKWFLLAQKNGDVAAEMNLIRSTSLMSEVQIAEAKRRAKAWEQVHAVSSR